MVIVEVNSFRLMKLELVQSILDVYCTLRKVHLEEPLFVSQEVNSDQPYISKNLNFIHLSL